HSRIVHAEVQSADPNDRRHGVERRSDEDRRSPLDRRSGDDRRAQKVAFVGEDRRHGDERRDHERREDGDRRTRLDLRQEDQAPQAVEVDRSLLTLRQRYNDAVKSLSSDAINLLREWPVRLKSITDPHYLYEVRGKPVEGSNYVESMSHQQVPKIAA